MSDIDKAVEMPSDLAFSIKYEGYRDSSVYSEEVQDAAEEAADDYCNERNDPEEDE